MQETKQNNSIMKNEHIMYNLNYQCVHVLILLSQLIIARSEKKEDTPALSLQSMD